MTVDTLPDVSICNFCQLIVNSVNPVNDELFHIFKECKQPLQYYHNVCDTCIRRRKRKLDREKHENTMSSIVSTMSFLSGSESSQQLEQAMLPPPAKKRPGPLSSKRAGPISSKRMLPSPRQELDDSYDRLVVQTPEHQKTKTDSIVNSSSQELIANRKAPRYVLHERIDSQIRQDVLSQSAEQILDTDTNIRSDDSSSSNSQSLNNSNTWAPAPREATEQIGGQPSFSQDSPQDLSDPASAPRERTEKIGGLPSFSQESSQHLSSKRIGGKPSFSEEIIYEDVNNPSNLVNQQLSMRTRSRSNSSGSSESISTAAPHRVSRVRENPPTRSRPSQPANVYRRNLGG